MNTTCLMIELIDFLNRYDAKDAVVGPFPTSARCTDCNGTSGKAAFCVFSLHELQWNALYMCDLGGRQPFPLQFVQRNGP